MSRKIAAVVVTYKRKKLLIECLEAILAQNRPLDSIILVDNASMDGTPELLREKGYLDKNIIDYVRLEQNKGGSGGFYYGVKRGYEKGFDWIWLMDDDAEPSHTCLSVLEQKIESNNIEGVICPVIKHKSTDKFQWYHHKILPDNLFKDIPVINKISIEEINGKDLININANAFVGPLISKKAIDEVGFPEKDYFIWSDDLEYTYRISRKKDCFLCPKALIYHKDNNINANGKISDMSVWKTYYGIRNRLLFVIKHQTNILYIYIYILKMMYKSLRQSISLLFKKKAGKYSILPVKGFIDGLMGKTGKRIDPFSL